MYLNTRMSLINSDNMKQYLVVVAGTHGSGKTTVTGWMRDELDFYLIQSDVIGVTRFGRPSDKSNPNRYDTRNPEHREYVTKTVVEKRDSGLLQGKNVVIDGSFHALEGRIRFLDDIESTEEQLKEKGVALEKYMVILRADIDTRLRRRLVQRPDYNEAEQRERFERGERNWREPSLPANVHLLDYENSTPEQLDAIKSDLKRLFSPTDSDTSS